MTVGMIMSENDVKALQFVKEEEERFAKIEQEIENFNNTMKNLKKLGVKMYFSKGNMNWHEIDETFIDSEIWSEKNRELWFSKGYIKIIPTKKTFSI